MANEKILCSAPANVALDSLYHRCIKEFKNLRIRDIPFVRVWSVSQTKAQYAIGDEVLNDPYHIERLRVGLARADVMFIDTPSNAQSAPQTAARGFRTGQEMACNFYLITNDHSYDRVLQANAAKKLSSIIAAYISEKGQDVEIQKYRSISRRTSLSDDKI